MLNRSKDDIMVANVNSNSDAGNHLNKSGAFASLLSDISSNNNITSINAKVNSQTNSKENASDANSSIIISDSNIDTWRLDSHGTNNGKFEDMFNDTKRKYNVSIEIVTECLYSLLYWIPYRYFIIFDAPNWTIFFITKATHLLTEFFQSGFRVSKIYQSVTYKLYIKTVRKCKKISIFNCILKISIISTFLDDNSTLYQWRCRTAIDTMFRFFIAIGSAIIMTILLIFGKDQWVTWSINNYRSGDRELWLRACYYSLISALLEFVYFITVIAIYNNTFTSSFIEPFLRLYLENKRKLVFILAVLFINTSLFLAIRELLEAK